MLCPELIGRATEIDQLARRLAELPNGHGGVVTLVGDAGLGKSRLVDETIEMAAEAGAFVLSGRAVPGDSPVPYRPLTEALLGALRGRELPEDPSLAGFEGQLARLVPGWSADAPVDDSPVLLGEAIVRLLIVLAAGGPCVLALEDLQWADAETLAVVEYLGDALRSTQVLCLATARPTDASGGSLSRMERRRTGTVLILEELDHDEINRMVGSCLATTEPPAGLADFLRSHCDGSPFLVEELLAGLVASGSLTSSAGRWEVTKDLTPSVPASLQDSVRQRLAALDDDGRRVLGAAALLGRRFDWELLPGISDVDGRTTVDALRAAVAEQLIEADGEAFRFRHALTREAVLDDLLPPERRELAAKAWPVVERANPGLPGASCQLAADLAEAAGEPAAAAERLVECSRRALAGGALATAESTARRALLLAVDDPAAEVEITELLVEVLAAAGDPTRAVELGLPLVDRLDAASAPASRQANLLVALARAALASADLDAAEWAVARAREVAPDEGDPALLARIDAAAAELALDRVDLESAEELSRRSIELARSTGQTDVECEALLVLGRATRPRSNARALETFQEAADVAEAAGLGRWHLRARQELALDLGGAGSANLPATRDVAARYGAHLTVAAMDLALADLALTAYDRDACLRAATACVEASRRYRLAAEPVAHLWLAGAHTLAGDDDAMEAEIDAALGPDPDDPRILADLYGRVLATRAFVRDELDSLAGILDRSMVHVRTAPPTLSVYPGRIGWALLHTIDDPDHGAAARAEYHDATDEVGLELFRLFGDVMDAVADGRAGGPDAATARLEPALAGIYAAPICQGMSRSLLLLVAQAAIRDGWGDPVRWLRECEAWFAEREYGGLVRRSRLLMGDAGAPVPRRGRGDSEVPTTLRSMGVTSREMDVLKLVAEGRTTKEIAAQLYLSPKTVERHLTSLFSRTGVGNRRDLARLATDHLT